jgi:hypothetical protein
MQGRTTGQVILALAILSAAFGSACSDEFESDSAAAGAAGTASGGKSSTAGSGGSVGGDAADSDSGAAGASVTPSACTTEKDCPPQGEPDGCVGGVACVDGACVVTSAEAGSHCVGGTCDEGGACVMSTCNDAKQDGDETGIDCGGSCGLCPDGWGCGASVDCLSGVCEADECQASACTDEVKNGDETGVDCGGNCPLKCALGEGCSATSDCAIAAGDGAESVRCVAKKCVSTKPPSAGGAPMYWQDFRADRLKVTADLCPATDKVCLTNNGAVYNMSGIGPGNVAKPLTKELIFTTDGVVGGGGRFDGYTCLTRPGTDLSLPDLGAFTAMAWVKSTRVTAPWESAIIGALDHYFLAIDTNVASQRFLTAVRTEQHTSFAYNSSDATGEIPNGEWHHVAATYSTAAGKLLQYVDGKLVQTTPVTGNVTTGAVAAYVGCRKDTAVSYFFLGTIDEIATYRRALSAEEIADYVTRTALP